MGAKRGLPGAPWLSNGISTSMARRFLKRGKAAQAIGSSLGSMGSSTEVGKYQELPRRRASASRPSGFAVRPHIMAYVRNRHPQQPFAVFAANLDGIVKIFGIGPVYGNKGHLRSYPRDFSYRRPMARLAGKLPAQAPSRENPRHFMAELDHVLLNLDIIFPGPEFQTMAAS